MLIRCILDEEDEELLIDPFGEMMLTNKHQSIIEKDTFLYAWLAGLISGLEKIQIGERASVCVGEPALLVFEPRGSSLVISYTEKNLFIDNIDDFERALISAIKVFLDKLSTFGEPVPNPYLETIRAFVNYRRNNKF